VVVVVVIGAELENADRITVRAGLEIDLPAPAHRGSSEHRPVLEEERHFRWGCGLVIGEVLIDDLAIEAVQLVVLDVGRVD